MGQPIVKRTWAPVGKTPIFRRKGRSHDKATIIGAVAYRPGSMQEARFLFRLLPGENANAAKFRLFLDQLMRTLPGRLVVVWDRLNAHRAKSVRNFVHRHRDRLKLEYFPPYAPELNPVEQAWAYLKGHRLANYAAENLAQLTRKTKTELCRMRQKRHLNIVVSWLKNTPLRWD